MLLIPGEITTSFSLVREILWHCSLLLGFFLAFLLICKQSCYSKGFSVCDLVCNLQKFLSYLSYYFHEVFVCNFGDLQWFFSHEIKFTQGGGVGEKNMQAEFYWITVNYQVLFCKVLFS